MQKIELKKQVLLTFKAASFHTNKSRRNHARLDLEIFPICKLANCLAADGLFLAFGTAKIRQDRFMHV